MADVKWIKIVTDIFDDEKIRFIETMPNGDEIIVIWFKILCLCGKSNNGGFLMFTGKLAYTEEMLASIFNRDIKSIQMALKTFKSLEMVEMIDNKIYIANWEKHQTLDKLEAKKQYDREYQRKKREEKKQLLENRTTVKRLSNDNRVTDKDIDIDIDIDIEEDIDKDIKERNIKERNESLGFNAEKAWNDTFSVYPKKTGAEPARIAWMDKLIEVISDNRKDVAKLIYLATKMYVDDYATKNPNDSKYQYVPKYEKWLREDCDYWIVLAEKEKRK